MTDLSGDVFLVGAGGEHRSDVGVAEGVRRDVLADGRQALLGAQCVSASDGRGDHVARDGVAVMGVVAAVGEGRFGRLPAIAERVLVGAQLVEQVVVDVDHAGPGRGLGVDHADDAVGEVDVGAAQCAQLADAQPAEDEGGNDRAAQRHRSRDGSLGLVDAGRRRPVDADTDLGPGESLGAEGDDLLAQLV